MVISNSKISKYFGNVLYLGYELEQPQRQQGLARPPGQQGRQGSKAGRNKCQEFGTTTTYQSVGPL